MVSVLGPEAAIYAKTGKVKERSGSASNTASPRNVYRCADGKYIALSGSTQQVAHRIFEIIGKPEMKTDPRFADNSARVKHRELVDVAVGAWFAERDHDDALKIMRDAGATVGPVYSAADAADRSAFRRARGRRRRRRHGVRQPADAQHPAAPERNARHLPPAGARRSASTPRKSSPRSGSRR